MNIILRLILLVLISFFFLKNKLIIHTVDNQIMMKIYLFVIVFIFEFIINLLTKVSTKCIISNRQLVKESSRVALILIVAYCFLNDFLKHKDTYIGNLFDGKSPLLILPLFLFVTYLIVYYTDIVIGGNTMRKCKTLEEDE